MIHSLFLINHSGDIFLEKHWKSVVNRSVCDYFFEAKEKAVDPENVPPVLQTPHHYLISIYRGKLFFLSVIQNEVPPLFVIEFLHRVADTMQVWLKFGNVLDTFILNRDTVVCRRWKMHSSFTFILIRSILEIARKLLSWTMWWQCMSCWRRCSTTAFRSQQNQMSSKRWLSLLPCYDQL